jgi:DNA mismatch repair protein MutS
MDNLWAGLSSFAVEMTELREILQRATESSLVLGDELCSGTESVSATALVGAGLQWLHGRGVKFIFAMHLHGLLDIRGLPPLKIWHLKVRYEGATDRLIYERTLTPGPGSSLYGLEVARAMNLPDEVLAQAGAIRRQLLGTANESEAPMSQWNGGIQRRECEVCSRGITKDLEVHHIRGRAEAVEGKFADGTDQNSARNLIVVCAECHDKHHAGELEIGELRLTSDGLERSSSTVTGSMSSMKRSKRVFSQEETECIQAALAKHKGRPLTRILVALEEQGVRLTPAQLKQFQPVQ